MENKSEHFEKIEKKIWQMVLLAVVVILFLTVALLGVQFLGFLGEIKNIEISEDAYKYSVFLAILVLLFCAYMLIRQRKILQLSRDFF
ncbi:MAG: hypothetical protein ABIK98_01515 [Pseudomonadota bacterium]|nr:hypothetical protein [Desulfobacteraceae bacterium]